MSTWQLVLGVVHKLAFPSLHSTVPCLGATAARHDDNEGMNRGSGLTPGKTRLAVGK